MNLENQILTLPKLTNTSFNNEQIGKKVIPYEPNKEIKADIAIVGTNDYRGENDEENIYVADNIRKYFYSLYTWQDNVSILDFGNIERGHNIEDTQEAIAIIQETSSQKNIPLIVLGGSQDLTIGQYKYFSKKKEICNLCCIDPIIDFSLDNNYMPSKKFLHTIFLEEPNYMQNYFHVGLQSYLQQPNIINKLFNLNFETYRIGKIREDFSYTEPCFRTSSFLSIDIQSLSYAYSPASTLSPNGFTSEEFCLLGKYAGMSQQLKSIGIYGLLPSKDDKNMSAKLIAQFLWFILEGQKIVKYEGTLKEKDKFIEYPIYIDNVKTIFYQNKVTGRWWMKIENYNALPCAYQDYIRASKNELTDRWSSYFNIQ